MSGHTPGPWKVIENGGLMMAVVDSSGEYLTYRSGHMRLSVSEMEANANLIAAAPDLLEACERAEYRLATYLEDEREMALTSMEVILGQIRSAIARAKGEA